MNLPQGVIKFLICPARFQVTRFNRVLTTLENHHVEKFKRCLAWRVAPSIFNQGVKVVKSALNSTAPHHLPRGLRWTINQKATPNNIGSRTVRIIFHRSIRFSHFVFLLLSIRFLKHDFNQASQPRQHQLRTVSCSKQSWNFACDQNWNRWKHTEREKRWIYRFGTGSGRAGQTAVKAAQPGNTVRHAARPHPNASIPS